MTAGPNPEAHLGALAHLRAETDRWALPLAPPAGPLADSSPLQPHQAEAGPPAWQAGAAGRAAWGEPQGGGVLGSSQPQTKWRSSYLLQRYTMAIVPCGNPTPKKLPTGGGEWPTFRTAHGTPPYVHKSTNVTMNKSEHLQVQVPSKFNQIVSLDIELTCYLAAQVLNVALSS